VNVNASHYERQSIDQVVKHV